MSFRLLNGIHIICTGKWSTVAEVYAAGDIIESDDNLCELFPDKFEEVTE